MRRALKAVAAGFTATYATYTQYRIEYVLYMAAGAAPIYMMFAWISLADSGMVADVDPGWFAAYFLVVYGTRQATPIWQIRELDQQIRLGDLSHHLLRPVPFYWRLIGWHLGDNAIRLPVVIVIVPLGLWAMDAFAYLDWRYLPFYLLGTVLGVLIHLHLEMLIGLAAFWTNQSLALEDTYITCYYLLAGFTVPLAMFPEGIQQILLCLPFYYIFAFPSEVLLGEHTGSDLAFGLLIQLAWIVGIALAARLAWRRGLRRYTAVGS